MKKNINLTLEKFKLSHNLESFQDIKIYNTLSKNFSSINTRRLSVKFEIENLDFNKIIEKVQQIPHSYFQVDNKALLFITKRKEFFFELFIDTYKKNTLLNFNITYKSNKISETKIKLILFDLFKDERKNTISADVSIYFTNGGMIDELDKFVILDDIIYPEAYPYIPNLDPYIDQYIISNENILLLLGSPGSGKTRLIRYILHKIAEKNDNKVFVKYSMDKKVIESDNIFVDHLRSHKNNSVLVLEDIDFNLSERLSNNTSMYKLLGTSDGLLGSSSKKIILSTNLKNTNNIDPALLREGRCFDIIETRYLYKKEALNLFKKFNLKSKDLPANKNFYSLGDLYRVINNKKQKNEKDYRFNKNNNKNTDKAKTSIGFKF